MQSRVFIYIVVALIIAGGLWYALGRDDGLTGAAPASETPAAEAPATDAPATDAPAEEAPAESGN